ncbi:flagellar protein FlaG [Paenibacillus polymyxa]|uniref:Flagellar protein FlaG n=1 Tax=Paenibacillus polymyxa TaxID=1406 RepID=A0A378Y4C9_PAEPO|nr:flagellar protein FlaG [Paenibacillus polymyxa]MBE7898977.1 flagellar protein FlaG [Paenibacillus polymyxa]MBG9763711.1 flagellar protein FlaG [Paenibacillus polymyxa]MCC3259786.1 flagellar protein FlaG [Paenibacillus polymyxa]QPK53168.1 flagellar protein FlaG [Paenibacillus polymyxa]QPK58248.1 flagellar protein FlaG [Paenibacillus polymyxa]
MEPLIPANAGSITPIHLSSGTKKEDTAVDPSKTSEEAVQSAIPVKAQQTHEQTIQQLQKAIDAIQGPQKTLEISVHEKTHAIMIKVLNKETGDLIREVPPEKILDLAARMMEITGIIVDKKV